jgi:three-Cys-motif partner protein
MKKLIYDHIGYWSEIKLDIIKDYVSAYTNILAAQKNPSFKYIYIDAFSGAGRHVSRETGDFILGSPLNALNIPNQFHEYHFIDLDESKVAELESLANVSSNVFIYHGDCNEILPREVLPRADYKNYCRALCILDPYGLHLNWEIIELAGKMNSIEIFLNFPVMDINMNVLKHNKDKVAYDQIERMNAFWGDDSWEKILYKKSRQLHLFGGEPDDKVSNIELEAAFRKRLKDVAGFKYIPEPMPMRNSNNAIVYYLYFASQNNTGKNIIEDIVNRYAQRRDA